LIGDLETDEFGPVAEAEVCVLGAGPAGIAGALELAEKNRNVILLESGGESYDVRTQGLYDGHNIGREYYNLTYDRVRYLGGTSHHWGRWCAASTRRSARTQLGSAVVIGLATYSLLMR